jgi:hypothetical protein
MNREPLRRSVLAGSGNGAENKVEVQFRFVVGATCLIKWNCSSGLFGRARCIRVEMRFLLVRGCGMEGIFWGNLGGKMGISRDDGDWRDTPGEFLG